MFMSKMPMRALEDITNHVGRTISLSSKRSVPAQKSMKNTKTKRHCNAHVKQIPINREAFSSSPDVKYIDIDATDKLNHKEGSDFASVIHKNHLEAEGRHHCESSFLDSHKTVTQEMRSILVDWIADVCVSLKLRDSTLHLCVNVLDRFLQSFEPTRKNLQLVGSVCLYIAAKYEEIYAPDANDFVTLADGAFDRGDVVMMEAKILNALRFEVTTPYCLTFLARIEKTLDAKGVPAEQLQNIMEHSQMLVELAMVDGLCLKYRPSQLSAAAVLLAFEKLNMPVVWCESLSFHSGWSKCEILPCLEDVRNILEPKSSMRRLSAIRRKFAKISMPF